MFIKIIVYTLIPLVAIDAVWLVSMNKPFYSKFLGSLMAASPSWVPVILFYILYAIGIAFFVISPSLDQATPYIKVFLTGAFLGLVAYGTYDLTNNATLRDWPVIVTLVDLLWGMLLTGTVSLIAFFLVKNI